MPADDPPSPAEAEFLAMRQDPDGFARWCAEVRTQWEREHGVEWLHGAVWRRARPPDDPERPATFRFNPDRAAAYRASRALPSATARTGTHPRTRG